MIFDETRSCADDISGNISLDMSSVDCCSTSSALFPEPSTTDVFSVKSESCRNIVSDNASLNLSVVGSSLSTSVIEEGMRVGVAVGDVVGNVVVGFDVAIQFPMYKIKEGKKGKFRDDYFSK